METGGTTTSPVVAPVSSVLQTVQSSVPKVEKAPSSQLLPKKRSANNMTSPNGGTSSPKARSSKAPRRCSFSLSPAIQKELGSENKGTASLNDNGASIQEVQKNKNQQVQCHIFHLKLLEENLQVAAFALNQKNSMEAWKKNIRNQKLQNFVMRNEHPEFDENEENVDAESERAMLNRFRPR